MSFAGELERSIIRLGGFSPLTCFDFFQELQDRQGSEGPGGPTTFPKGTEVYYFI